MIIDLKETGLSIDFSNCFNSEGSSSPDLLSESELAQLSHINSSAISEIYSIRGGKLLEHGEKALFFDLPFQDKQQIDKIKERARYISSNFKYVISFGIGGSYLGNSALFQALKGIRYNEGDSFPKLYFLGNNLDPQSVKEILGLIELDKLHIIITSKSGSTLEPLASFSYFYNLLKDKNLDLEDRITIITGFQKSILFDFGRENGIYTFLMPEYIGGRFSVLSVVGLLSSAIVGIDIDLLLAGARKMTDHLFLQDYRLNPALCYADIGFLNYRKRKNITVLMPYSDRLHYLGLWYIQLFSESLGKKGKGRTPLLAIGTTDMHSQTQQHQEGSRDKMITFIEIEDHGCDIPVMNMPSPLNIYRGSFDRMMHAALKANQRALYEDNRPNCCIKMERLNAFTVGAMIVFFEASTVIEGILMQINPFDQPGVEHYKRIMKEYI